MRASTFWVSASVSERVEFTGIVIEIGNVGLEDWSRRFTRKSGIRAIEAAKKAAAAPSVSRRWPVAHWITGTYTRCVQLHRRRRSTPSARTAGSNRAASSGTTVTATTSEASSATTTVSANGRKKLPAMPVRKTIGKKTATVVAVDEATAVMISRAPV